RSVKAVRCQVVRWVNDEPFPGWVEVLLFDAYGVSWIFHDKPPMFAEHLEDVLPSSSFSVPGVIRCHVLGTGTDAGGKAVIEIELIAVEAEGGTTRFTVRPDQIVDAE